jgi:hypothetical protein
VRNGVVGARVAAAAASPGRFRNATFLYRRFMNVAFLNLWASGQASWPGKSRESSAG